MKPLDDSLKTIQEELIKDNFINDTGGDVMIEGSWYAPKWGCDTMDHVIDFYESHIRRILKEQRAEIVIELENIKLPKYEGSAKSAMRLGIQAERDFYNKEINKLITKLEQGEEK